MRDITFFFCLFQFGDDCVDAVVEGALCSLGIF